MNDEMLQCIELVHQETAACRIMYKHAVRLNALIIEEDLAGSTVNLQSLRDALLLLADDPGSVAEINCKDGRITLALYDDEIPQTREQPTPREVAIAEPDRYRLIHFLVLWAPHIGGGDPERDRGIMQYAHELVCSLGSTDPINDAWQLCRAVNHLSRWADPTPDGLSSWLEMMAEQLDVVWEHRE